MIDSAALVREARSWLGTPYHHGAACKGAGVDCIGLIVEVAAALGVREAAEFRAAPEFRGYGSKPDPALLLRGCATWLDPITLQDAAPGDVLVLRFGREPQHFALVTQIAPMQVVHALAQSRRVVEHRVDAVWARRILRVFRFRGAR